MKRSGVKPLMAFAVAAFIVALLLPSMPVMVDTGTSDPTMCRCGCGNIEGKCCCAAPRTTQLAFSCAEREDPSQPIDTANGGKIIVPPEQMGLSLPMPGLVDLADLEFDFSELDPRPEVPPPRT